jgi:hypothetical protein
MQEQIVTFRQTTEDERRWRAVRVEEENSTIE